MIQLEVYLKEISNFLRTLTIKNTFIADHMWKTWVNDSYKDKLDYKLHPYYRNLTGDYILFDYTSLEEAYGIYKDRLTHEEYQAKFDDIIAPLVEKYNLKLTTTISGSITGESVEVPNEKIYSQCNVLPVINSFDTQEKIPFTKELLTGEHINTAEIYKIPNDRYYKLLEKYPSSSAIIKAIVYPIKEQKVSAATTLSPIDVAYNADNFSLLAYGENILEEQEFQSIYDCVYTTLDMIRRRYAINEYCFENLYPQAHEYLMWQILYLTIFVQRISNIRSGNVHTYHLWSYLKSHGFGEYRDVLSIRQQQFLYRNLEYLIRNKGTQHALEILIYVLLQSQNIALQGKNTKQMLSNESGLSSIVDTAAKSPAIQSVSVGKPLLDGIAEMYKANPKTRFQEVIDYMGANAGHGRENDMTEYENGYQETSESIYYKEKGAGIEYSNDYLFSKSMERCDRLISTSPISHRNTKLLELTSASSSDLYIQLYTKFFAETLMYRASRGDLSFSVSFIPPNNINTIVLPAVDAIGVLFYLMNKINKNKLRPDGSKDDDYTGIYAHNDSFYTTGQYSTENKDPSISGEGTTEFTGNKRRRWTKGDRIYRDIIATNRPPNKFAVEWAYSADTEDGDKYENGFAPLAETFKWKERTYNTSGYLNSVITKYRVVFPDNTTDYFNINSTSIEETNRIWTNDDENLFIQYYSSKGRWVIIDKSDNILYYSSQPEVFTSHIENLTWYEPSGDKSNLSIYTYNKKYIIDISMQAYRSKFHSVTDFSSKVHNQAMDFINLYLENSRSSSALHNEIYKNIREQRYVNDLVSVNFFNGKTFTEYFDSDDDNIAILREVFTEYDKELEPEISYGNLYDTIIDALVPIDDNLLGSSSSSMTDKYNKIIKLFKSMIPYNLTFIASEYKDINSTVMPDVKDSEFTILGFHYNHENDILYEDLRANFFEIVRPNFIGQTEQVTWGTISSNETLDLQYKYTIINNIGDITSILDSDKTAKTKRAKLKKLLSSYYTGDALSDLISYLLGNQERMLNLYYIVKNVKKENPKSIVSDTTKETKLFNESVILIGKDSEEYQLEDFNSVINNL